MIGTSVAISPRIIDFNILLKEPWHKLNCIHNYKKTCIGYSYYESYFIKSWNYKDNIIIYEGCIYNLSQDNIQNDINKIAESKEKRELISEFVKKSEGDYLITIYNRTRSSFTIFNDILGGMAAHYYSSDSTFLFSRSLSFIAINIPHLEISRVNLIEFTTIGFNICDHTIFNGVKKLEPSSCIIMETFGEKISVKVSKTTPQDFSLKNKYKNKEEAAIQLADIFTNSVKRRIEFAQEHSYEIVNSMSGGFDSRTILGGIEKFTHTYTNLTYEYKQDESAIARKVLKHIHSKSNYIKLSFKNTPHLEDSQLTLETDGKIECYTNSVCYNDLKFAKENPLIDKRVLFFGGFGGEYLRHPYPRFLLPPKDWFYLFNPSIKLTSNVFFSTTEEVTNNLHNCIKDVSKKGKSALAKFLYNEYYQNLVRCSGEERIRLFFWTIHPMMSNDFILAIRNRVPLKWVGFHLYKKFLKEIDSRLTEVELMGNSGQLFRIDSDQLLKKHDAKMNYNIRTYLRVLRRKYTQHEINLVKRSDVDLSLIEFFYNNLHDCSFINFDYIKNNYCALGKQFHLRLLTVLEYLYEIQKYRSHINNKQLNVKHIK